MKIDAASSTAGISHRKNVNYYGLREGNIQQGYNSLSIFTLWPKASTLYRTQGLYGFGLCIYNSYICNTYFTVSQELQFFLIIN